MRRTSKFAVGTAALIALVLVGLEGFQRPIGMALFERGVKERAGRDVTAGLPDGLHVALCGTGSPLPDPTRAGPCTVVIAGKRIFVVDTGDGSARNVAAMGIPTGRIEALFLTHFHSDHIDGLGPLMLLRWTGSAATSPLPIHGPPGVDRVVAGFNAAYALDNGYRVAHHGAKIVPPTGAGGVAIPFALSGNAVVLIDEGGLKVTAFRVDHGPVKPAVGYRFDYKGRSAVLSGDTAPTPNLIAASRGADLLIHEALEPAMTAKLTGALDAKGQKGVAQITRDIINYHASPEQAADDATAAGVRFLVLDHIVPPLPLRFAYPAFLGDAAKHFAGPIRVGEDGMAFSLPAGSDRIEEHRWLDR